MSSISSQHYFSTMNKKEKRIFVLFSSIFGSLSIFELLYNLVNLYENECGWVLWTALIYHGFSTLTAICSYSLLFYLKVKEDYHDLKYMECNYFYVLSILLILSSGVIIVSSLLGEVNFYFISSQYIIFDCMSAITFFNSFVVFGSFNLTLGYLLYRVVEEVV